MKTTSFSRILRAGTFLASFSATMCSASFPNPTLAFLNVYISDQRVHVALLSGNGTSENGSAVLIGIRLGSAPLADVQMSVEVTDATEARADRSTMTFTRANWETLQVLRISGRDDFYPDGPQKYSVRILPIVSTDPDFNQFDPVDVNLENADDDTPGFAVTQTSGLQTTESGGQATVWIRLKTSPAADVQIPAVVSSDVTEGTPAPASLTFTPSNWYVAQSLTIAGVDDALGDGSVGYLIVFSSAVSADPAYNGLQPPQLSVTNVDNESAGITVTPISGLVTTEGGGAAAFTVSLNTIPAADVQIPILSLNAAEGTPSTSLVTLNAGTMSQVVTITGVDDAVKDGDVSYMIEVGTSTSADGTYQGFNPPDVAAVNSDNEKFLYVTSSTYDGILGGVAGADAKCSNDLNRPSAKGYKAVLFAPGIRVACLTAECAGGPAEHTDWSFTSGTSYFREDAATRIMTTNANAIFAFTTGILENSVTAGSSVYWTALNGDWTGAGTACTGWTLASGAAKPGNGTETGPKSISDGSANCGTVRSLLCAEQ